VLHFVLKYIFLFAVAKNNVLHLKLCNKALFKIILTNDHHILKSPCSQ